MTRVTVQAAGVCGVRGVLGAAAEEATEMDLGVLGVEKPEAPVLALSCTIVLSHVTIPATLSMVYMGQSKGT